jgi:hypothetical protein
VLGFKGPRGAEYGLLSRIKVTQCRNHSKVFATRSTAGAETCPPPVGCLLTHTLLILTNERSLWAIHVSKP